MPEHPDRRTATVRACLRWPISSAAWMPLRRPWDSQACKPCRIPSGDFANHSCTSVHPRSRARFYFASIEKPFVGRNPEEAVMRKYVVEREIPKVGTLEREQLREAAAKSNEALRQLGPDIQWLESFVAADKTFCVYLAKDEAIIRRHAELSGFPATKITQIGKVIDPTTGEDCGLVAGKK